MLLNNKLFNSIACLLSSTNLQLVILGRTWILLYLGRTVYKRLWACLALYGKEEEKAEKSKKFILTAFSGQLSGGLLSQRVLQGLFPVNTGVTGVTDEVIQGLRARVTGNTEIQGVTWWAIIQGFGAL